MLRRGNLIPLILSALGVLLLRNEGRYVLILSGLLTALLDRRGAGAWPWRRWGRW